MFENDQYDKLRKRYLNLFTKDCLYIRVGLGWYDIIDHMLCRLDAVYQAVDTNFGDAQIYQIKEKFGGLRVYYYNASDEYKDIVKEAEKKAATTCEKCGEVGIIRNDLSWIRVLCDVHYKEKLIKIKK